MLSPHGGTGEPKEPVATDIICETAKQAVTACSTSSFANIVIIPQRLKRATIKRKKMENYNLTNSGHIKNVTEISEKKKKITDRRISKISERATGKQKGKKQEKFRGKETVNQQDNGSKTSCQLRTMESSTNRRKQPRHKAAETCYASINITKRQLNTNSKHPKKQNADVTDADSITCGTCGDVIADDIAGRQWLQCQQPNCGKWYHNGCQGLEESDKPDIFFCIACENSDTE